MDIKSAGALLGKKGGDTTKKLYGKKHFSEAGKKGMESRWGKRVKPDEIDKK